MSHEVEVADIGLMQFMTLDGQLGSQNTDKYYKMYAVLCVFKPTADWHDEDFHYCLKKKTNL